VRALVAAEAPVRDLSNLLRLLLFAFAPAAPALLLHAAAIEQQGASWLFFGPSHAGKSTVSRLSAPRRVLSDDAVLLEAAGSPVAGLRVATAGLWGAEGSEGLAPERRPVTLPAAAAFQLRQAASNQVRRLTRARAALALLGATSLVAPSAALRQASLAVTDEVAARLPVFELEFSHRDGSFWQVVEAALKER
jgi:hypothetical protein